MLPDPLHPAIVHFPIVLVAFLPGVAVIALVLIHRGAPARGTWAGVVALAAVLSLSAWVSVETGEEHEEAVEAFFLLTVGDLLSCWGWGWRRAKQVAWAGTRERS